MASEANDSQQRIVINFIDPLFSVVLSTSFAQIYIDYWFTDFRNLWHLKPIFIVATLGLGYLTVILSWVGYHQSIKSTPIRIETPAGRWRFGLDVVLLITYFVLLVSFGNFRRVLWTIVVIYLLFFIWDQMKYREIRAHHQEEKLDSARRRGVTVFWFLIFLGIAVMLYFYPLQPQAYRPQHWLILVSAGAATILYRFHKKYLWLARILDRLAFVVKRPVAPARPQLRIYVAGPYTASEPDQAEKNAKNAIDAGIALLKKGHIPFIPHLTHYVEMRARENRIDVTWDDYMKWDSAWLDQCDALLYLGSSRGADIELQRAKSAGKTVFDSIETVPEAGV